MMIRLRCMALLLLILLPGPPLAAQAPQRTMAITIDDLPANTLERDSLDYWRELTDGILVHCRTAGVRAVGFVNEGKLYRDGRLDRSRVDLLRAWLAAGMELGNHTFSHPDLHRVPVDSFLADAEKGQQVTRALLAARNDRPRWFRHPYLHTGTDSLTRSRVAGWLEDNGYAVAPVTIDNSEWIYARAYENALRNGDTGMRRAIAADYLRYMLAKTAYFESQARGLFEREIPQVLLLHANRLNADHLGDLLTALKERGYRFVPLADAVADPAYRSADRYFGPAGLTWLHRWALTRGVEQEFFAGEPETPPFVLHEAGFERE